MNQFSWSLESLRAISFLEDQKVSGVHGFTQQRISLLLFRPILRIAEYPNILKGIVASWSAWSGRVPIGRTELCLQEVWARKRVPSLGPTDKVVGDEV